MQSLCRAAARQLLTGRLPVARARTNKIRVASGSGGLCMASGTYNVTSNPNSGFSAAVWVSRNGGPWRVALLPTQGNTDRDVRLPRLGLLRLGNRSNLRDRRHGNDRQRNFSRGRPGRAPLDRDRRHLTSDGPSSGSEYGLASRGTVHLPRSRSPRRGPPLAGRRHRTRLTEGRATPDIDGTTRQPLRALTSSLGLGLQSRRDRT